MTAVLVAFLQYALPSIIGAIEAHQKANNGQMPTAQQLLASNPDLAKSAMEQTILEQGEAWKSGHV